MYKPMRRQGHRKQWGTMQSAGTGEDLQENVSGKVT